MNFRNFRYLLNAIGLLNAEFRLCCYATFVYGGRGHVRMAYGKSINCVIDQCL